MAKISIITPVYNVENYLDICLDSILAQSYKDFEVICVDDGSTDSSPEILKKYAQFDKRIRVFHKTNGGLSDARNFGMEHITGEYTTFVDSDDWLSHLMLERLYRNITEYNSDFNFCCGVRTVDNSTRKMAIWQLYHPDEFKNYVTTPYFNEADTPSEFIYKMHTMAWGKLYRTEFIKDLRFPKGKIYEDNPFFVECYLTAKRISYDHAPLYYYRLNRPESIIKTKSDKYKDIFDIADMVKAVYEKYGKFERYKTDYLLHYLKSFFYYTLSIPDDETKEKSFELMKERINNINPSEYDRDKLKNDNIFGFIYSLKDTVYPQFVEITERGLRR